MKWILAFIMICACQMHLQAQTPPQPDRFDEISTLVRNHYMESINFDSIVEQMVRDYLNDSATIRKLLYTLDPYATYFDPDAYTMFMSDLSGSFGGVGLAFDIVDQQILVSQVFEGTPAFRGGLKVGDRIVQIDDQHFESGQLDYWTVMQSLRGEVGTEVKISLLRNDQKPVIAICIREQIHINSVSAAVMLDDRTGYIKLTAFTAQTAQEVHAALESLLAKGMRQLIFDLRDNPGGYMKQATRAADEFLPQGALMVYTEGRGGRNDVFATSGGLFEKGPMILLVNANTASSGEILTAAIQGNERAKVVGQRTFGKGLVQQIFPIQDSLEAVKLTTEKYYTPKGVCIQQPFIESTYTFTRSGEIIYTNDSTHADSIAQLIPNWGITPDHFSYTDTTAVRKLVQALEERNYLLRMTLVSYIQNRAYIQSFSRYADLEKHFPPDASFIADFEAYIKQWDADPENYFGTMDYRPEDMQHAQEIVLQACRAHIAGFLWGTDMYYTLKCKTDPDVQQALTLLKK
ncbi:MAG TPA: S41 family peptidase [Chitinophagales bacterium]|nr:S41 family peptidase [Chitinophagales bacterium]